jgi:hypothetical protein
VVEQHSADLLRWLARGCGGAHRALVFHATRRQPIEPRLHAHISAGGLVDHPPDRDLFLGDLMTPAFMNAGVSSQAAPLNPTQQREAQPSRILGRFYLGHLSDWF